VPTHLRNAKEFVMNMLVRKIGLLVLLSASTLAAFANSGQGREMRDVPGEVRQQHERSTAGESQAARNSQYPESFRSPDEGFKKHSRLSPEERRALRRQINEAGQDLYIRKP
jgi:hypothetical protein